MKDKILLVHSNLSSFVKQDYEILSSKYTVDLYLFKNKTNAFNLFVQFVKQFIYLTSHASEYKGVIIWFCDYHAFLPTLFSKFKKKKSFIIVGGFDAYSFPSLNYGLFNANVIRKALAKKAYKLSDKILPVDASLIYNEIKYIEEQTVKGGLTYFVNGIADKIETLPTAFDSSKWHKPVIKKIKNTVLTVGMVNNDRTFLIKGLDLYIECAQQLPEFEFRIVGLRDVYVKKIAAYNLPNLKIYGFLDDDELMQIFHETQIYAQFSRTEGLPSVVCEAMLSECIPVGTNVGGIKNLVSDTGIVIDTRNISDAVSAIKKAQTLSPKREKSRERALSYCDISHRKKRLEELLD